MKTPIPVCIIATLPGIMSLMIAVGWTSLYSKDVVQQPFDIQIAFFGIGIIICGTSAWLSFGLFRGSRDALMVTLAFCWLGFVITTLNIVLYQNWADRMLFGLVGAVFLLIYRVLTSSSIWNGFFRCR